MSTDSISPPKTADKPAARSLPARFTGKVALVTGANDRGFGGAIAERFVREGAAVALLDLQEPKKLLRRLGRLDANFIWSVCDVTRQEDVNRAIDTCMEEFGQIDVVVNSAGVSHVAPFEKLTDHQWQQTLDVNLSGVMRVTRAALPHMPEPGGAIVNIASALGPNGCQNFAAYNASKMGLIGMTQALALELAPRGMRAVCVAPALAHTPMLHSYAKHFNTEIWEKLKECHPLGLGSAHDVAAAVAFLASDEARWITGVTLPLGWTPNWPLPVDMFDN